MADTFDPYHKWLGIPPDDQPPNHYRLLGVALFESDPDVIESVADQRMAHLRNFQGGKHVELSQRLLNEVSAARVCLLNTQTRQQYDTQLRGQLTATPISQIEVVDDTQPTGAPVTPRDSLVTAPNPVVVKAQRPARRKSNGWVLPAALAGGAVVALALIGIVAVALSGPPNDDVAQSPDADTQPVATDRDVAPTIDPVTPDLDTPLNSTEDSTTTMPDAVDPVEVPRSPDPDPTPTVKPVADATATPANTQEPAETKFELGTLAQVSIGDVETRELRKGVAVFANRNYIWTNVPVELSGVKFAISTVASHSETIVEVEQPGFVYVVMYPGEQQDVDTLTTLGFERTGLTLNLSDKENLEFGLFRKEVTESFVLAKPKGRNGFIVASSFAERQVVDATKMQPVPSDEDQAVALTQLQDVFDFAAAKTPEQKSEMVSKLLALANESQGKPAEQFVVLSKARELAAEAGDVATSYKAADQLATAFEIGASDQKRSLLVTLATKVRDPDAVAALVGTSQQFVEMSIADGRLDAANEVAIAVFAAVGRRRITGSIREQAQAQRDRVRSLHAKWKPVSEAMEALKTDPSDADAHLAVGGWYCFGLGDWERGCLHLARCSNADVKAAAETELKLRGSEKEFNALADLWWVASAEFRGPDRDAMKRRAGRWNLLAHSVANTKPSKEAQRRVAELGGLERLRQALVRDTRPDGKRMLLTTVAEDDVSTTREACQRYGLEFEHVSSFKDAKIDAGRYHTVVVGTNGMDYWGKEETKLATAFDPVEKFVSEGGHLLVYGTYNGRNCEHLKRFGVTTGYFQNAFFRRNGPASTLLFRGVEHLVQESTMNSAGNFRISVPHEVLLERGEGRYSGEPALATLRHGKGRVTITLCEPSWRNDLWLIDVLTHWTARGCPTPESLKPLDNEDSD